MEEHHLHVIDELGVQEIAGRLGLSNDLVRARLSRGLRFLAGRARSSEWKCPKDHRTPGVAFGSDMKAPIATPAAIRQSRSRLQCVGWMQRR